MLHEKLMYCGLDERESTSEWVDKRRLHGRVQKGLNMRVGFLQMWKRAYFSESKQYEQGRVAECIRMNGRVLDCKAGTVR